MTAQQGAAALFEQERPRLTALAYRMLGERALAEDVVQDCWLRLASVPFDSLEHPARWLRRVASNIALDQLRAAKRQRETYVGPWLPEPIVSEGDSPVEAAFILAQDCELALLWAMERLAPVERCAFVLREAFDADYAEIAETLGKTEAACRQMVSRAHKRLQTAGPRFGISEGEAAEALERFFFTASHQHGEALRLLARDAIALTDGGGQVSAAKRILRGAEEILQVFRAILQREAGQPQFTFARVRANGQPALARYRDGQLDTVALVSTTPQGAIDWIYMMRNPLKLSSTAGR